MIFKIEYNFLDITNSPSIERYFETRASEGWLINKIYLGSVFIFKKMEPQTFDFLIRPYEIESFYSCMTKNELQEFQGDSEAIDWNYVIESYDLHIYYKEKESQAIPIQTDDENLFVILESIAKKRIRDNWIQIFWLVFLSWFNISGMMSSVSFLTEGAGQILLVIIATGLTIATWYVLHMKRFISVNQQNIELGEPIEYSESKFIIPKFTFFTGSFFIFLFFLYFLYLGFVLKNQSSKVFFLIFFVGIATWGAYRVFVKPVEASLQSKRKSWIMAIFLAFFIGAGIGLSDIDDNIGALNENIKIDEFKVLTATVFPDDQVVEEYPLYRDISLTVPESYEYFYINEKDEFIQSEYGRALNECLAKNLTQRYLNEQWSNYHNWYTIELKQYFNKGIFDNYLLTGGVTEDELSQLAKLSEENAVKKATQQIIDHSITTADETAWDVDEIYYLDYAKRILLIRNGNEVFYLAGKDFTETKTIEQTKKALDLVGGEK